MSAKTLGGRNAAEGPTATMRGLNSVPLFTTLEDDRQLKQAISKARETVTAFTAAFAAERRGDAAFLVKLPLADANSDRGVRVWSDSSQGVHPRGPDVHLWLRMHDVLGDLVFVHVFEAPNCVMGISVGQTFVVEAGSVEDWVLIVDGLAYGGYTLRLQRDILGEQARSEFDALTGIERFAEELPQVGK